MRLLEIDMYKISGVAMHVSIVLIDLDYRFCRYHFLFSQQHFVEAMIFCDIFCCDIKDITNKSLPLEHFLGHHSHIILILLQYLSPPSIRIKY